MIRFLIRRLLFALLVLLITSFVVFFIFYVVHSVPPRQRAAEFAGKGASNPSEITAIVQRYGFNHPWYEQYGHFLNRLIFHFDFGTDFFGGGIPVRGEIFPRLPVTAELAIGAAIIWLIIGIPFGVLAATKPRSIRDRLATLFSLTFYSVPTFVLGLLLLFVFYYLFAIKLHITPFSYGTYVPLTQDPLQSFRNLVLPWFTLALVFAASYSRVTRGSMLDVLGEDYIRTARAKGLSERKVIYKHGLRAALTPIVTLLGVDLGTLLGGTVVTERLFDLQGVGAFSIMAVQSQDLPVISATVLIAAAFVVIANLVVDILYGFLDPRVRIS